MPLKMEAESPPSHTTDQPSPEIIETPPDADQEVSSSTKSDLEKCDLETTKSSNSSDDDPNLTLHPFNLSNLTVIEKHLEVNLEVSVAKSVSCEGSDSGVEIVENNEGTPFRRTLSSNSGVSNNFQDFDNVQSCDSSISYCSNYDEAFNILVRRNSSLFENCTLRHGDGTSENGSESSSVTGSSSSKNSKRNTSVKKRVTTVEAKSKSSSPKDRTRTKPPITPRTQSSSARLKSLDRLQGRTQNSPTTRTNCLRSKQVPNNLEVKKEVSKRPTSARTSSTTRTPVATPTDDGRWPSVHSKPAPLLSKSLKGTIDSPQLKRSVMDTKTIEKYATLPRRRKEKSADELQKSKKAEREPSANRPPTAKKSVPRESLSMRVSTLNGRKKKIKIYQENGIQTALTMDDIDKALSGHMVRPASPEDKEFGDKGVQVDMRLNDVEALKDKLRELTEKHDVLVKNFKDQGGRLKEVEEKWRADVLEKEGLQLELKQNTERVLTILGENNSNEECSSDSLMVLETRFQNVSQIVLNQENEISRLNALCRSLQINLDQAMVCQRTLVQQHQELEAESFELQEFMQAEKSTLADALRESESEIKRNKNILTEKEMELTEKQEECTHLVRLSEKRRQENLSLQAKLGAMEAKCRDLLVQQGSSVSGAAVALSALSSRLDSLANELIASYNISEQELEDVIFHNEVYNNSSADTTPERGRKFLTDVTPSPTKKGSSFVSAVINAIRNNAPFSRDLSRSSLQRDASSSNEMLDSETEPCLMMEHVLEDVIIPDGHSHNMISSTHSLMNSRLTHSESLKDLSQAILNRERSEQANSLNVSFSSEMGGSELFPMSLVDQVIDVDNSITRLLKVIRIIQVESEDCMNELEDQKDCLSEQIEKQKETNKFVVKQLKDWEFLGARLKGEVKDLKEKLAEKDSELEKVKMELNKQREQLERQNQDVCELSTALSKIEMDVKVKEEEVNEAIKMWDNNGEVPSQEILGRIINLNKQYPEIKELIENEQHREELKKELVNRQILTEKIKEAVGEAKKQYEAIDNALEVLHNVQSVVQQCPQLSKLQRDLEEISFQSASKMPLVPPPDLNANAAALLQVIKNLEIASPINTTA